MLCVVLCVCVGKKKKDKNELQSYQEVLHSLTKQDLVEMTASPWDEYEL